MVLVKFEYPFEHSFYLDKEIKSWKNRNKALRAELQTFKENKIGAMQYHSPSDFIIEKVEIKEDYDDSDNIVIMETWTIGS